MALKWCGEKKRGTVAAGMGMLGVCREKELGLTGREWVLGGRRRPPKGVQFESAARRRRDLGKYCRRAGTPQQHLLPALYSRGLVSTPLPACKGVWSWCRKGETGLTVGAGLLLEHCVHFWCCDSQQEGLAHGCTAVPLCNFLVHAPTARAESSGRSLSHGHC